jgi:CheY-like chemotaxis protein
MHVLIIEDDLLTALYLGEILSGLGFDSHAIAMTEAEAVASARRRCPDLITADVRLQAGSGIAAVRTICAEKSIPVIYVTASRADLVHLPDVLIVDKPVDEFHLRAVAIAAIARRT